MEDMKIEKLVVIVILVIVGILAGVSLFAYIAKDSPAELPPAATTIEMSDAARFKSEYNGVSEDNRFIYATNEQVLSLFDSGTGLVFLGFTECPWCQSLSGLVDEAAKNEGLDKIYYINIKEDRRSNTSIYQSLVTILKPYLKADEQGEPVIYVPDVTAIKEGRIVGRYKMEEAGPGEKSSQSDYWTAERKKRALEQLQEIIRSTY